MKEPDELSDAFPSGAGPALLDEGGVDVDAHAPGPVFLRRRDDHAAVAAADVVDDVVPADGRDLEHPLDHLLRRRGVRGEVGRIRPAMRAGVDLDDVILIVAEGVGLARMDEIFARPSPVFERDLGRQVGRDPVHGADAERPGARRLSPGSGLDRVDDVFLGDVSEGRLRPKGRRGGRPRTEVDPVLRFPAGPDNEEGQHDERQKGDDEPGLDGPLHDGPLS